VSEPLDVTEAEFDADLVALIRAGIIREELDQELGESMFYLTEVGERHQAHKGWRRVFCRCPPEVRACV
jgi:hypothetical protein